MTDGISRHLEAMAALIGRDTGFHEGVLSDDLIRMPRLCLPNHVSEL
jgi:hypothetical protein